MSAKELQEALILSSKAERTSFERRNTFDLVVLTDADSEQFGDPSTPLGVLFRIIYETEFLKPLRRSPVFLQGGIKAWANDVGEFIGTQAKEDVVVAPSPEASKRLSRKPAVSNRPTSGSVSHTRMPQDAVSAIDFFPNDISHVILGPPRFLSLWQPCRSPCPNNLSRTRCLPSKCECRNRPLPSPDRRYDVPSTPNRCQLL